MHACNRSKPPVQQVTTLHVVLSDAVTLHHQVDYTTEVLLCENQNKSGWLGAFGNR